ncbi:MAG: AAC(3) family N-acetyltransferase [Candidatus Marinimicrobia bacterium]|nr:AAC(3) family N-acetyltransferase [Candidatus Neomarinimicrobiota bacterium]
MDIILNKYFQSLGLAAGQHVIVHSSFGEIKKAFTEVTIENLVRNLQQLITPNGSLVMPAFTYCYKRSDGTHEVFNYVQSQSKVGAVSEVFRQQDKVLRTSSPTHSFSLWGKAAEIISQKNSPASPLGKGSVLDWMNSRKNAYVLLIGVDFNALSFGHYLENMAPVPWTDISPWDYLKVEKAGVSITGEQKLKELPGCSKPFKNFEKFLLEKKLIEYHSLNHLKSLLVSMELLYKEGLRYFHLYQDELLCPEGTCVPCDCRREKIRILHNTAGPKGSLLEKCSKKKV